MDTILIGGAFFIYVLSFFIVSETAVFYERRREDEDEEYEYEYFL